MQCQLTLTPTRVLTERERTQITYRLAAEANVTATLQDDGVILISHFIEQWVFVAATAIRMYLLHNMVVRVNVIQSAMVKQSDVRDDPFMDGPE